MSEKGRAGRPKRGVWRVVAAALALAVVIFCGWSAWQYAHGADPLAFVGGSPRFGITTSPAADELYEQLPEGDGGEATSPAGHVDDADQGAHEAEVTGGAQAPSSQGEALAGAAGASAESGEAGGGTDASTTGAGSSADGQQADSGEAPASQPQDAPAAAEPAAAPAPSQITVSVSIDGSAGGGSSWGTTVTLSPGATAYDALLASGASVGTKSTGYGMYVSSIGGLAELEHGPSSGWLYAVNGSTPGVASSGYVLADGDSVYWFYVTE
jgi:hypothetical protein